MSIHGVCFSTLGLKIGSIADVDMIVLFDLKIEHLVHVAFIIEIVDTDRYDEEFSIIENW